jgi:hypothetical protein
MRCVGWVGGLILAGTIAVWGGASTSVAADLSLRGAPAAHDARFLYYGGFDGWSGGGFAHGGLMWAPRGLDKEGFVAKFMTGGGVYGYLAGTTRTAGYVTIFDAAPGWHFKRGVFDVTVYAGLDVQNHRLRPDDLNNRSRGTHAGARVGADVWAEPTPATMLSGSASFATVGRSYWSRLAYGWRMFDNRIYFGPELHATGDEVYRQWRVGAHVTALKLGRFEWSAGAGLVSDSSDRSGIYGRIGFLMRR